MPVQAQSFRDDEFGEIIIKRRAGARNLRIHMATDGQFVVACGKLVPLRFIRNFIDSSRDELRKIAQHTSVATPYQHGQIVGHKHKIAVVPTQMVAAPTISIKYNNVIVKLPPTSTIDDQAVQQKIRDTIKKILRKEAKQILPQRLALLAAEHGFHYERVRFSHAGSRWGSCSSSGTISLNIALMKLPDELINYVLIHELCHTRQMNHSAEFWREVEHYDPHYRTHRQQMKRHTPIV